LQISKPKFARNTNRSKGVNLKRPSVSTPSGKRLQKIKKKSIEIPKEALLETLAGPFSIDCITNKPFEELYKECYRLFETEGFIIKQDSNFKL
jgi:hypothetical protein